MSTVYNVNSYCLRYVIPFRFSGNFEDACKEVENQKAERIIPNEYTGKIDKIIPGDGADKSEPETETVNRWVRKVATLEGPESDLYSYVKNEFRFADNVSPLSDERMGCEWIFWKNEESPTYNKTYIKDLLYFEKGIKQNTEVKEKAPLPPYNKLHISRAGLYLFRNNIGFIWYEFAFEYNINSSVLRLFQNKTRELNRSQIANLWEETDIEPEQGYIENNNNTTKYITPFSLGEWIHNDMLKGLNVSYLAERKSAYASMIVNSMNELKKWAEKNGKMDRVILSKNNESESLTDKRDTDEKSETDDVKIVPDKPILFSYIALDKPNGENSLKDRQELSYHLTNGYKESYLFSDEVGEEMRRPFDNVIWYATQEGASYIAWPTEANKNFFRGTHVGKMRTDYYTLYIKALYQSYSLMIYAEKIQKEISSVAGRNFIDSSEQHITELFEEINLFLTKSMATSVSHIHHQSTFYVYLKGQLRIHDDVKSVTSGLNALDALQREQRQREEQKRQMDEWKNEQKRDRDEKKAREKTERGEKKRDEQLQAIMGLFALLGISSALVDCFDFIGKFNNKAVEIWSDLSNAVLVAEIVFICIIIAISGVTMYASIRAIIEAYKNNKDENDNNETNDENDNKDKD